MEADSRPRKTILTMVSHYLPGNNAGGPIRSISNLVDALGDEFDFLVLASDRDLRSPCPYEGIATGTWLPVGKAKVMYLSKKESSIRKLMLLLRDLEYDLLYLNSFFARRFSMLPCFLKWLGLIPDVSIVLTPRGEFSQGALKLKYYRKKLYIRITKYLGVYKSIIWQASSEYEKKDIVREFGINSYVSLVSPLTDVNYSKINNWKEKDKINVDINIINSTTYLHNQNKYNKKVDSVKLCFLSRISPMKNLDMAIELLDGLNGIIRFDIYGPIEDRSYWKKCEERIRIISTNVTIEYKGEIAHELVGEMLSGYDFFLFPTCGENYGHVIMEALLMGCPVIISDQTPWRNLETRRVGWDLPLENRDAFRKVLQKCIDMDADEYTLRSALAREYAVNRCKDPAVLEQNRSLFMKVPHEL